MKPLPLATYRIQFHKDFKFRDLRQHLPYLAQLGIDTIYASPIFQARPGSTHGYDVTNANILNPEIGTPEEFESLMAAVKKHGLKWLQDIVPNHMAFHESNAWLMDVFEKGPASGILPFFRRKTTPVRKSGLYRQINGPVSGFNPRRSCC